jgi:hypothetical protein
LCGSEGTFTKQSKARLEAVWDRYASEPRTAMLFRAAYVEDVRGRQGVGPCPEMGGNGAGESDRGIAFFYRWSLQRFGRWEFPRHVK